MRTLAESLMPTEPFELSKVKASSWEYRGVIDVVLPAVTSVVSDLSVVTWHAPRKFVLCTHRLLYS